VLGLGWGLGVGGWGGGEWGDPGVPGVAHGNSDVAFGGFTTRCAARGRQAVDGDRSCGWRCRCESNLPLLDTSSSSVLFSQSTVLYCPVLYSAVLSSTVLYCTAQIFTRRFSRLAT